MGEKHYLLTVCGQVEPVLDGPLDTPEDVLAMAREHWRFDPNHRDGLFRLSVDADGVPHVEAFVDAEIEE